MSLAAGDRPHTQAVPNHSFRSSRFRFIVWKKECRQIYFWYRPPFYSWWDILNKSNNDEDTCLNYSGRCNTMTFINSHSIWKAREVTKQRPMFEIAANRIFIRIINTVTNKFSDQQLLRGGQWTHQPKVWKWNKMYNNNNNNNNNNIKLRWFHKVLWLSLSLSLSLSHTICLYRPSFLAGPLYCIHSPYRGDISHCWSVNLCVKIPRRTSPMWSPLLQKQYPACLVRLWDRRQVAVHQQFCGAMFPGSVQSST